MRITHLTTVHRWNDGRILRKECVSLARAGHHVTLVAPDAPDTVHEGVHVVGVRRSRGRAARMTVTAYRIVKAALMTKADVYHFHDPELLPVAAILSAFGKRLVYDTHEDTPAQILGKLWVPMVLRRPLSALIRVLERGIASRMSGVIHVADEYVRRLPSKRTVVVRNLPLIDRKEPAPHSRSTPPRVLYFGGVMRERGAIEMVRGVAAAARSAELRFDIAGVFMPPSLEDALRAMGEWDTVTFHGWLEAEDVAALLKDTTIGLVPLLPTRHHAHAYPTKLFDYMAAGVPVVAADLPHVREIVESEGVGVCVDFRDPDRVTEAIVGLLADPERIREMSLRARSAAFNRYSWDGEAEKLIRFYDEIAASDAGDSGMVPK